VWFGDSYDDIIYIYASGKIFRMGIPMQGEAASFPESSATSYNSSNFNKKSNIQRSGAVRTVGFLVRK
tara:strand:- start:6532 stop:6735 length:204 start_codon:yes stop_codon:yes gene_type:complete